MSRIRWLILCGCLAAVLTFTFGCKGAEMNPRKDLGSSAQPIAMSDVLRFYAGQGKTTDPGVHTDLYADLPKGPDQLVPVVQGLLLHG